MEIRVGILEDILQCWYGLDDLCILGWFRVLMGTVFNGKFAFKCSISSVG